MPKPVIVTSTSAVTPKKVLAEDITILADHSQTGSYEVYIHDAPEGAGPPPHSHPWDEAFYVTQGAVNFTCDGVQSRITAGGFVHVPAGTVHSFRYATPTAQIVGITSGAGAAKVFTAVDRECGPSPQIDKVLSVLADHDVTVKL